jgi:hypothetical protein
MTSANGLSRYRILAPLTYMAGLFALSSIPGGSTETAAGALMVWVWALNPYPLSRHSLLTIALLLNLAGAVLAIIYASRAWRTNPEPAEN